MYLNHALKASVVVMGLSLAACVSPADPQATQQSAAASDIAATPALSVPNTSSESNPLVTANFIRGGGTWDGVGSIVYRYIAIERNGEVYICGAHTGRGSTNIRRLSREVMRQATVTSNGRTVMRNLRFFKEASNAAFANQLVGVETACRSTGRTLEDVPLNSIRVETREGRYRIRG